MTARLARDSIRAMRFARNIRQRTRGALGPALCLCALAYFGYHAVQGNYGLLALKDLERQRAELEVRATALTVEHETLAARVGLLKPQHIDPDMLEEQVRATLGFAHADDVMIIIPR